MNIEFINNAYTVDGLMLPMVHFESKEKDICVICIHGMCGTIVDNYFATVTTTLLPYGEKYYQKKILVLFMSITEVIL